MTNRPTPDEARAFDCICCGARYVPDSDEHIFYQLCISCFNEFDAQKMLGRFEFYFGNQETAKWTHLEDAQEWAEQRKAGNGQTQDQQVQGLRG